MTALSFNRPLQLVNGNKWRINAHWAVPRIPNVILATLSSYGVNGFIHQSGMTPELSFLWNFDPIAFLGAMAFDAVIIGTIALADQQITTTRYSQIIYYALNIGATGVAGLFNTLFYAGGTFSGITFEAFTHGSFFALFSLLYSIFYATVTRPILETERVKAEAAQAMADEESKRERDHILNNPYACKYNCGERYPSAKQRSGHYAHCTKRPPKPPKP